MARATIAAAGNEIKVDQDYLRHQGDAWESVAESARLAAEAARQIRFGTRGASMDAESGEPGASGAAGLAPAPPERFIVFRDVAVAYGHVAERMAGLTTQAETASRDVQRALGEAAAAYRAGVQDAERELRRVTAGGAP